MSLVLKRHECGLNVYKKHWDALTRDKAFEGYLPEEVCISLKYKEKQMGIPIVRVSEYVIKGQIIGVVKELEDIFFYASISGVVTEIFHIQCAPGVFEPFIKIRKEIRHKKREYPFAFNFDKENILKRMYQIGIVTKNDKSADQVVVNAFANEPYITSGYRLIMESPGKVVLGTILAAEALDAKSIYIYINEDAVDAVGRLKRSIQKYGRSLGNNRSVEIVTVKHRYPAGNAAWIKKRLMTKEKEGQMIVSLAQMTALYDIVYDGEPWIKVGITVSGKVENPKNLWVPIGTNIKELVKFCGSRSENMIVCGGPLSGRTTTGENEWIQKDTTGILVLEPKEIPCMPCIQCGACREACPENLKPDVIEKAYLDGEKNFQKLKVDQCIQCGLCSYVCPAGRRLSEYIGQVIKGRFRKTEKKLQKENQRGNYIDYPEIIKKWKWFSDSEEKSESPPHVHRKGTIEEVMRNSIYGLLPLILGLLFKYKDQWMYILAMIAVGGISAGLAEYSWQKLRNQFNTVRDGSAVFSGIMLALFFEADTSLVLISGAAFFVIWFGKQCFGGIGHAPVHPAILGKLIFQPLGIPMFEPLWYFSIGALVWMLLRKMQPISYSLVFLILTIGLQPELLTSAVVYLTAAYFVWSYETMPPTKAYRWIFTLMLAFLSVILYESTLKSAGICFAIAIADAFVPWMKERYNKSF